MKEIKINQLLIGSGIPKICVPVTGRTEAEIVRQTEAAVQTNPDILEWRADFYENLEDAVCVEATAKRISDILGEIPILFTIRTKREGGMREYSTEDYVNALHMVETISCIQLVDVELMMDRDALREPVRALKRAGKIIIASNHHFDTTPSVEEMTEIFAKMEESDADIRKLAVMPKQEEDVLALLYATVLAKRSGEKPVISMSMGKLGAVSRVCGEVFGSCVTFGMVGEASAPGQIPVAGLREIMRNLN